MGAVELEEEAKKVLAELGLTDYERRVYFALLKNGPSEADAVSKDAEVPYSKIYEVLNSLISKGWIESDESRPKKYYPKSPSEAFTAVKMRLNEKIRSWEKTILRSLQPVYEKRVFRERPDIWILRGEFDVLMKLEEMLSGVKDELMIAMPSSSMEILELFWEELNRLASKGIKVQIMMSEDCSVPRSFSAFCEVRRRDSLFGGGVIADIREVILVLSEKGSSLLLWSNHIGLVKLAKEYFKYLWNSAIPVES